MKKLLRILLIIVLVLVVAGGAFAAFVSIRGIPEFEAKDPHITVQATPERIERGRMLVNMLCADCHKDPKTGKLTGTNMDPMEKMPFGLMYSQNITHDKTYGIGNWTDGEIIYLLRTGIKKDGQYAPPWMAKVPHMSDEDINSVIAFIRSDDPMVAADATPDRPCEPSFFAKFLCLVAFKPLPYPDKPIPPPDTTNKVAWGQYLVWNLDCYPCHSADFAKTDAMNPPLSAGYLGGGNFLDSLYSANITPHEETGIGKWSEAEFVKTLRFGLKPDGTTTRMPMKPYNMLSESEAKAIYAYLRTVPAISNQVNRAVIHE